MLTSHISTCVSEATHSPKAPISPGENVSSLLKHTNLSASAWPFVFYLWWFWVSIGKYNLLNILWPPCLLVYLLSTFEFTTNPSAKYNHSIFCQYSHWMQHIYSLDHHCGKKNKTPEVLPQNQPKYLKDRILFHLPPVREEKKLYAPSYVSRNFPSHMKPIGTYKYGRKCKHSGIQWGVPKVNHHK